MPAKALKEFLDQHKIHYQVIQHARAYTAQETAALAHVPGKDLAKTVMARIDGRMAMLVLPAQYRVDFDVLRNLIGVEEIELATEKEFRTLFPDCEPGAMPPFGNLYEMDVYVAEQLTRDEEISFNAGTHTELVRMAYSDFEHLVRPRVVALFARV